MLRLAKALHAWGTPEFEAVLKSELVQQAAQLPLQQALAASSSVADVPVMAVIYRVGEQDETIRVKAGIFYQGAVGGCSCTDDPTPDSGNVEHCVVLLEIDKATAAATVELVVE